MPEHRELGLSLFSGVYHMNGMFGGSLKRAQHSFWLPCEPALLQSNTVTVFGNRLWPLCTDALCSAIA